MPKKIGPDEYIKHRFSLLYKALPYIEFLLPKLGRTVRDLLAFTTDLATDELTGFSVRKLYYLQLNELIAPIAPQVLAGTAKDKIVVAVFDMAMLSLANEAGHEAGDGYITRVATAIMSAAVELLDLGAEEVIVGRLGGDEFGFVCKGLSKETVERVVKIAQIEVAKEDLQHIDAGIADLSDPIKLQQQLGPNGEILVSLEPRQGATSTVVRRLGRVADERANIAKAITRITVLANLLAFAPVTYERVTKFGMKAVSSVEEMELYALAEKLRPGQNIQHDVLFIALRVRSEAMKDTPFSRAVSLVAELGFYEKSS